MRKSPNANTAEEKAGEREEAAVHGKMKRRGDDEGRAD